MSLYDDLWEAKSSIEEGLEMIQTILLNTRNDKVRLLPAGISAGPSAGPWLDFRC